MKIELKLHCKEHREYRAGVASHFKSEFVNLHEYAFTVDSEHYSKEAFLAIPEGMLRLDRVRGDVFEVGKAYKIVIDTEEEA